MNAQPDPQMTTDGEPGVDPDAPIAVDTELAYDTGADVGDDDPYDSFVEGEPFAHHVISPALLAGFSDAPMAVCRVFHRALFELLDGVGSFDGLIVTPAALIGPPVRRSGRARTRGCGRHRRPMPRPCTPTISPPGTSPTRRATTSPTP